MVRKGQKLTEEQRRKISNTLKSKYVSGYVHPMKGRQHTIKSRENMSKGAKGKKHSEITGSKMSKTWKNKYANGYINPRQGKKVSLATKKIMSNSHRGQRMSLAARRKISESKKGELNPAKRADVRKIISNAQKIRFKTSSAWNKGKPQSEEHRQHNAEAHIGIQAKDKHPNWLGGKSFEPYGIAFDKNIKEQVRIRDGYRCQQCFRHQNELRSKNNRHYKLHIHHIDYNKSNNSPKNLVSLCLNCHMQTNFEREDWAKYFGERDDICK